MTSKTYEIDVPEGIIFRLIGDDLRNPDQLYRKIGQTTKIVCDEYGAQIGVAGPVFPDSECIIVGVYEEDPELGNEEAVVMGGGYPHFPLALPNFHIKAKVTLEYKMQRRDGDDYWSTAAEYVDIEPTMENALMIIGKHVPKECRDSVRNVRFRANQPLSKIRFFQSIPNEAGSPVVDGMEYSVVEVFVQMKSEGTKKHGDIFSSSRRCATPTTKTPNAYFKDVYVK